MLDALLCRWGPLRAGAVLDAMVTQVRDRPGGCFSVDVSRGICAAAWICCWARRCGTALVRCDGCSGQAVPFTSTLTWLSVGAGVWHACGNCWHDGDPLCRCGVW